MKHTLEGNTLTIGWPGDVLSSNVDSLRQETQALLEGSETRGVQWSVLKLDLTHAKMVDSAGLNLIVSIVKIAKARGATVRATVGNPNVYRTFIFTRLDKQLELAQAA